MALQATNAPRDGSHGIGMFGVSASDLETIVVGQFNATTGRFLVDATTSPASFTTIGGDTATVVTSGTAVQLPAHACSQVQIIANASNTGVIYVGGSNVLAANKNGLELQVTASCSFNISNSNILYIDSTHSGDTISFIYLS